jgi:prepilin-type N-terminal cleavage/methylation domain-containing protein
MPPTRHQPASPSPRGFTLIELLVVIGIIALLVGILVPVVSRVRTAAYGTDTQALMRAVQNAITAYQADFEAFPGPIPDNQLYVTDLVDPAYATANPRPTINMDTSAATFDHDLDNDGNPDPTVLINDQTGITGTENLVLGLVGGLKRDSGGNIVYDPSRVGSGPVLLGSQPGSKQAYLDLPLRDLGLRPNAEGLDSGDYIDDAADARDTLIPEILDRYPDPMPLLYLRAGSTGFSTTPRATIAGSGTGFTFDVNHVVAYTGESETGAYIGVGRDSVSESGDLENASAIQWHGLQVGLDGDPTRPVDASVSDPDSAADRNGYNRIDEPGPYDAIPYIADPTGGSASDVARGRDSYILISAGRDRVYGTKDDITSFGKVAP